MICITHLPQIASMAERHFTIVKDTSADPARATVTLLERGAVVGEIVRMSGRMARTWRRGGTRRSCSRRLEVAWCGGVGRGFGACRRVVANCGI